MKRQEEIENIASTYAIDEVKDTCNPASKRGLLYAGFVDGADWADSHPNWISVEDALPEINVTVLTTTRNGTQRVGYYDGDWWLANFPDAVRLTTVTHWMPLPQVPKGGER